jgi:hypothetical protein
MGGHPGGRRHGGSWRVLGCVALAGACSGYQDGRRSDFVPGDSSGPGEPLPFPPDPPPDPRPACQPFGDLRLAMPAQGAQWRNGWEQMSPTPFRGDILSIAGSSANDVWWSGVVDPALAQTALAHYDGKRTTALLGVGVPTWPIAVVSANEVWLGPHLRWVGGVLERSPGSPPAPTNAMRFFGSNDGWSAGMGMWHWNGAGWLRELGLPIVQYTAIDGTGPDDVWVAGEGTLYRWDGTRWGPTPGLPTGARIRDVRVRAADDVWAVGSGVFHYDGAAWQTYPSPIDTWQRAFANGSAVYTLSSGAIGQLMGGNLEVRGDNAAPCIAASGAVGACRDGFLAPSGELFLATSWDTASPVAGPWRRPAGATTSAGTVALSGALGDAGGPSADATFRATTGGDLLAVSTGKLYRGRVDGTWTELAAPHVGSDATLERLSGWSSTNLWLTFRHGDGRYSAVRYDGAQFGAPAYFPEDFVPEGDGPYSFDDSSGGCEGRLGAVPSSETHRSAIYDGTTWTLGTRGELVLSAKSRMRLVSGDTQTPPRMERWVAGRWVPEGPPLDADVAYLPLMATGPNDVLLLGDRRSVRRWDGVQWLELATFEGLGIAAAIYLGNGRTWIKGAGVNPVFGVLEKGCLQVDTSLSKDVAVSGNADRIFALDQGVLPQLRTRTFTFSP